MPSWARYEPYDLCLQGRVYNTSLEGSILAGSTAYAQIKTGALKMTVIHYDAVAVSENMRFTVLEAPTTTDGTTQVTPINVNRNVTTPALTKFYTNPSNISGGTTILIHGMPSGANKIGGSVEHSETWTIKPNTSYVIKIDNLGNSTSTFFFNMGFYEH